jgi:hypothetical protein
MAYGIDNLADEPQSGLRVGEGQPEPPKRPVLASATAPRPQSPYRFALFVKHVPARIDRCDVVIAVIEQP